MTDTVLKPNDVWIVHRQDIDTKQDGNCNVYFLLDADSRFVFGIETSPEQPAHKKIIALFNKAKNTSGEWPKKVWISKKDPFISLFQAACEELKLAFSSDLTDRELKPYVSDLEKSFIQFRKSKGNEIAEELDDDTAEELKAFIPETYGPCTCGSGNKFKFCCQKAFVEIAYAMCAAEEGNLKEALSHMHDAESKVGRTAEIVCRLAICWSFFDKKKSQQLIEEALKINPNHPRLNYIIALDAKQAGDFDLAVKHYLKAIEKYPVGDTFHLNEAYNNLGTAYFELNKYTEAKQAWEKALVFMPKDKMTRDNLQEFIYENPDLPETIREMSPFMKKHWMK